ncbi:aminoglycoside phosphotransferase [Pseudomonas floridensis]|uniref:Aminoglycoside phosphotransferase n=1 Tax=Pseudomonas floridensis TaxID=1958950 RepID=A0A1X0NBL5_9PSED|nr:aminoglycoside phosphotransferase family protein [Pseudomonas floridensis]ORC61648.1 aminoglycoside phosphotransferase [Pseudomonas floridensis]
MLNGTEPLDRLRQALSNAGLGEHLTVREGAQGIASPSRLATEWLGYHVTDGRVDYYAKVLQPDMAELMDIELSARASECAGQSGAAPRLIYADSVRGVLLFEALNPADWRCARLDELIAPGRIEALWALKQAVHSGATPDFVRSPMEDIQRLRVLCAMARVALPPEQAWIDRCVDMAWRALQNRSFQAMPIHGDGVASNVMVAQDGSLKLVDFDYGGCMDAWYDVAITLNELFPFEAQWREAISAWSGHCREADYAVCRLYALINDWYWTLWGFWAGTTSVRPLEFSKLGQWTFLRCLQSTRDPRLESWLRQVEEQ